MTQAQGYQVIKKSRMITRGVGTKDAKGGQQYSGLLWEVNVVGVPREQGRQEPRMLRECLNALVQYLSQCVFDFPNGLLGGLGRKVASCTEWLMSGGRNHTYFSNHFTMRIPALCQQDQILLQIFHLLFHYHVEKPFRRIVRLSIKFYTSYGSRYAGE